MRCALCGDKFQEGDLAEFQFLGEHYYKDADTFICPDCLDYIDKQDLEDQLNTFIGRGYKI